MEIVEIQDSGQDEWDRYVEHHPDATCFHWYGWRRPLEKVLGYVTHYLVARSGTQIVGILPFAKVSSFAFGKSAAGLPFCSYGGPVANSQEIALALEERAKTLAVAFGASYLEMRGFGRPVDTSLPAQDLYVTFRRALPAQLDDTMSFIPSKRRNMVRKAQKQGLTAQVSKDIDLFFTLYAKNARAHGTPALPKRFFNVLAQSLCDKFDILFVKDSKGVAISCIMNFYIRKEIHAGFAGEDPEARSSSANDLKYWELMKHALARQCDVFDFGRSKIDTGSYQFKKLWGFEPQALHYYYPYLQGGVVPSNNPNNAKFQLAIRTWKKLPLWFVNRLGPTIIHGLG